MDTAHDTNATPLKIIIAGAGIGGLCAAIALRRQGHEVSIYEQSRMLHETGAAIHIAPNCFGLLERFGMNPRDHGSVDFQGISQYNTSGDLQLSIYQGEMNKKLWQHPWVLIHRAHLHNALKELAVSTTGKGRPVDLHLGTAVQAVDPWEASLTLADGKVVQGDVVIGADGVHSACRKAIPGGDLLPFDSGKSAFRFLIPTKLLENEQLAAPFLRKKGYLVMWVGEDRRLVMYPCVGGTQMNFVAIHPSSESSTTAGEDSWQEGGSKAQMLQIFKDFGEGVAAVLSHVEESKLKLWTLLDMEQMPHFAYEKLAILGDAAHPFLPHQAQGGAQAIEDGASLGALLPLGTTPKDVPARLQLYEKQRYGRSHHIQEFTRISGADVSKNEKLDMHRFTAFNVGYDEWHSSTAALHKHLANTTPGLRWRTPIGFGPAPGPRQPLGLSLQSSQLAQIREQTPEMSSALTIRFKTSRTYLEHLLPPGFSFASPATICEATLLCNTLDGMTWLGGGGYSFVMLCLHGVKYVKRDGEAVFGTFLPLLFENLADPIITGRDDLGMPKLFADIDVQHQGEAANVKISWRGTEFGRIKFKGLHTKPAEPPTTNGTTASAEPAPGPPPPPPEIGQFAWRYVPAVGQPGKSDAEYPVCVPNPSPEKFGKDAKVRVAEEASFEFVAHDWSKLPTIHNVVRALAEMPQYGVVEAKHTKSRGVDDLSSAYRIE